MPYTPYLSSIAEMRQQGITDDYDDDELLEALQEAEQYIHNRCRQQFRAQAMTLTLDGSHRPWLRLPYAIVRTTDTDTAGGRGASITSVTISPTSLGADPYTVALTDLVVYDRTVDLDGEDDRMCPKIEWKNVRPPGLSINGADGSWRPYGISIFPQGKQNITIMGTFGYVEADGSIPIAIRKACRMLVYYMLGKVTDPVAADKLRALCVKSETTDDHSYQLDGSDEEGDFGLRWIDRRLAKYKRPMGGMTRPRPW